MPEGRQCLVEARYLRQQLVELREVCCLDQKAEGRQVGRPPGAASGPTPVMERGSTTRGAEDLEEADQEAH
eukprot:318311-Amphidinium_carterae.1